MVKRIGGFRSKTRHKLRKNVRQRGKLSITKYLQQFNDGDRVLLHAEPAVHGGMYHPRFHDKVGTVSGSQGDCYYVTIKDGNASKDLLIHPIHLRKVSSSAA